MHIRRGFGTPLYVFAHLIHPLLEARGSIQLLRLFAVIIVLWYERLVFTLASLDCSASLSSPSTSSRINSALFRQVSASASSLRGNTATTKTTLLQLTILSDPQLIDSHTYAWVDQLIAPISIFIQYILRWASDTYARKSFSAVVRPKGKAKSDGVIWLGDLLDGGRRPFIDSNDVLSFEKQTRRFKGLFEEKVPSIYLPGNHDVRIPLTHNPAFEQEYKDSKARWLEEWGIHFDIEKNRATWSRRGGKERLVLYPPGGPSQINVETATIQWRNIINARFPLYLNETNAIPTHEIILVDSLELAGMQPAAIASELGFDWQEEAKRRFSSTYNFVQSLAKSDSSRDASTQRILISHIPLSRPANSNCNLKSVHHGITRESNGVIDQGVDQYATYQNLLSSPVSSWLLDSIRPQLIFSGDNHDHCEVSHGYSKAGSATELTLKAFSMTEGVRLPGYARLSLSYDSNTNQPSSTYVPCLLPDQISIWTQSYPISLILLFACFIIDRRFRIGAGLDQQARRWIIQWQDWVGVNLDEGEDHKEEEWQMIEEGNHHRHYKESNRLDEEEEGEEEEGGGNNVLYSVAQQYSQHTRQQSTSSTPTPGAKRIRFGGGNNRSSLSLLKTKRLPIIPRINSAGISSSFQSRAWRELRRAAKASEKVILRDGPLREFAKVLLWPFVVWIWLQIF